MKKILLTICCVFSVLLSYAQGAEQSAESVWEAYQADPSKMYTFIDAITNSDSPKDFIPYVQRFVNENIKRGVDWDALYDELKETILPKDPDVATYFGVSLAQNTESYSNMIKALDVLPKTHTFDNYFIEDAVIYPDGRIVIVINGDESKLKYGRLIYTLFEKDKEPNIISHLKQTSRYYCISLKATLCLEFLSMQVLKTTILSRQRPPKRMISWSYMLEYI